MSSSPESSPWKKNLLNLAFYCWIGSVESIKILYLSTCSCQGQPFNAWFFPAFHYPPWTFFWTYHGITWLAGPYSILWWILDSPAYFGYPVFFGYLLTVDLLIFYWLQRKHRGYALYWLVLTVWFTTIDPVDFFPILFSVVGRYRLWSLILGPLVKLPVGAPLSVWHWVVSDPNSLNGPENYGRYLILGSVWTVSVILYLKGKRQAGFDSQSATGLSR